MRMTISRLGIFAGLILFPLLEVLGQTTTPVPTATGTSGGLTYTATAWNWAVAEWRPMNLSDDRLPLTRSLPLLFSKEWETSINHKLSEVEKNTFRQRLLAKARAQLDKEDSRLRLERDRILLTSSNPDADLASLATAVDAAAKNRKTVEAVSGAQISLPETLPLKKVVPEGQTDVVRPQGMGPQSLGERVGADYLFTGQVEESAGYLHVVIVLWSVVENRSLHEWSDVFAQAEAAERLKLARESFQEFLLGRPWCALKVEVDPPDAKLYINDKQSQQVPYGNTFLEPGLFQLRVKAAGYEEQKRDLTLVAGQEERWALKLEKSSQGNIQVVSDPPGASLWIDSQFVGITPVSIPHPLGIENLKLTMKDYLPFYGEVLPQGPDLLSLSLKKESTAMGLQEAKDRFYLSLACFSFSLTTTIFLKTFSEQYGNLTAGYASTYDGSNTAWNNLVTSSYTQQGLQGCYYAGVALTTGVFVWMMFELGNYLNTAEYPLH